MAPRQVIIPYHTGFKFIRFLQIKTFSKTFKTQVMRSLPRKNKLRLTYLHSGWSRLKWLMNRVKVFKPQLTIWTIWTPLKANMKRTHSIIENATSLSHDVENRIIIPFILKFENRKWWTVHAEHGNDSLLQIQRNVFRITTTF